MRALLPVVAVTLITAIGCTGFQHSATTSQTFNANVPGKLLKIETKNGSVEVLPGNGDQMIVDAKIKAYGMTEEAAKAALEDVKVVVEEMDDTVYVRTEQQPGFRGGVSFKVQLPADLAVAVTTSNGSVSIERLVTKADVVSSNGTITIAKASGPVNAKTSNGSLDIRMETPGQVVASTSNGRVKFTGSLVGAANKLSSSNGSMEIQLIGDPVEVHSNTSNGNITLDGGKVGRDEKLVVGGKSADIKLVVKTSNGNIDITHQPVDQTTPSEQDMTPVTSGAAETTTEST